MQMERADNHLLEAYIDALKKYITYTVTGEDLRELRNGFKNRDPVSLVERSFAKLKSFQVPPDSLRDERCKDNFDRLQVFSDIYGDTLSRNEISLLVGGSNLYGDPEKGDVDVAFVMPKRDDCWEDYLYGVLKEDLYFPKRHVDIFNVDASEFVRLTDISANGRNFTKIFHTGDDVGFILGWRPMIASPRLPDFQEQASNLLSVNRLVCATTYMHLRWNLKRRASRR